MSTPEMNMMAHLHDWDSVDFSREFRFQVTMNHSEAQTTFKKHGFQRRMSAGQPAVVHLEA